MIQEIRKKSRKRIDSRNTKRTTQEIRKNRSEKFGKNPRCLKTFRFKNFDKILIQEIRKKSKILLQMFNPRIQKETKMFEKNFIQKIDRKSQNVSKKFAEFFIQEVRGKISNCFKKIQSKKFENPKCLKTFRSKKFEKF